MPGSKLIPCILVACAMNLPDRPEIARSWPVRQMHSTVRMRKGDASTAIVANIGGANQ
jgi:hypothetical protein